MTDSDFNQINSRLDQLGGQIAELRQELTEQRSNILTLQVVSSQLLEMNAQVLQAIRTQQRNADADRSSFQAEIRRIWEYLLEQRSNGHGG